MHIDVEIKIRGQRNRIQIGTIERDPENVDKQGVGLQLAEVKSLIAELQQRVAAAQVHEVIGVRSRCTACAEPLPRKGSAPVVYRTAFGKLHLNTTRHYSTCACGHRMHERRSFNPMAKLLAERSHPELIYLQTRWAAHVSYERASAFLADVLPVDAAPSSSSIKEHVQKVGTWIDSAAFRNAENFFNSTPFQLPDPPIEPPLHALQLDAGYVRAVPAKCDGRRSFSIIVGRLKTPRGPSASIAYVNEMKKLSTMDRFHHFLEMHDVPINTPVAIMTDGGVSSGCKVIQSSD